MKEILRSHWSYMLYDKDGKLLLSVMCGSVGIFDRNIYLNDEEIDNYNNRGQEYIEELSKKIRKAPSQYKHRHINIDDEIID